MEELLGKNRRGFTTPGIIHGVHFFTSHESNFHKYLPNNSEIDIDTKYEP